MERSITDLSAKLERCGSGCHAEQFPERIELSTRSRTNAWRNRTGSSACKTPTPSRRAAHHGLYLRHNNNKLNIRTGIEID